MKYRKTRSNTSGARLRICTSNKFIVDAFAVGSKTSAKCWLRVNKMKHTKTIINHRDNDGGDKNDDDDRVIPPFSHVIFKSLGVGRRKSWWSTMEMELWRRGRRVDSTGRPASLRRWCIWWTRSHQRPRTSLWQPMRRGTCRMWTWRLVCNTYTVTLERNDTTITGSWDTSQMQSATDNFIGGLFFLA